MLNFSFPSFSSVIKRRSWFFLIGASGLKFLFNSSILTKSSEFESFIKVLLSMLILSFIKDGSSQIFAFIACGNLSLVCILVTFASQDRNTVLYGAYRTKTVLFSLIEVGFLICFLAEKSIDLVNSIAMNKE